MKNYLSKFKCWLGNTKRTTYATIRWAKRKNIKVLTLTLIVIVFAVCLPFINSTLFAFYAILLQAVGAFILIKAVVEKLKIFNKPSLTQMLKAEFSIFPPIQKKQIPDVKYGGDTLTLSEPESPYGFATKQPDSFSDLSEVVSYFNEQISGLHNIVITKNRELYKEISNRSESLSAAQSRNKNEIREIKKFLEEANTENAFLEVFGAFCLMLGLLLSFIQQLPQIQ